MKISSKRFRSIVASALLAVSALATSTSADELLSASNPHRLTYVFDSTLAEHAARLLRVEALSRPFQDDLEVLAVSDDLSRPAQSSRSEIMLSTRHGGLGTYAVSARVLAWFAQPRRRTEDLLLLEDGSGNLITASAADVEGMENLSRTLATTLHRQMATEVDFSTWGKVKELFR